MYNSLTAFLVLKLLWNSAPYSWIGMKPDPPLPCCKFIQRQFFSTKTRPCNGIFNLILAIAVAAWLTTNHPIRGTHRDLDFRVGVMLHILEIRKRWFLEKSLFLFSSRVIGPAPPCLLLSTCRMSSVANTTIFQLYMHAWNQVSVWGCHVIPRVPVCTQLCAGGTTLTVPDVKTRNININQLLRS